MLDANAFGSASNALIGDAEKLFNDTTKSALFLVNQNQPTPTNQPAPATVLNQWNQLQSELAADVSETWQAFVQLEYAVWTDYLQTFATRLADVEGHSTGQTPTPPASPSTSATTNAPVQGQPASTLNDSLMSYSMTAPSLLERSSQTLSPDLHHNQQQGGSNGPLYVLNLNNGETIPANVTLNTFSNWSENLLAQVSGGTVSSYSWNLTQAPDLGRVSGQNTANLQGTWNPNASAKKDIISVTETPQIGQPITLTMTFEVAGISSPAYSSSRPTSSSTWPTVITPDQLDSGQATQAAGPYAQIGLADGSVHTSFAMPSYNSSGAPPSMGHSPT